MKYDNIIQGIFISRPNRFIAKVNIDGNVETVHVKNTGRCKELLIPGCTVFLNESNNALRKTKYDLIAVIKERKDKPPLLINMDSQIPNYVAAEYLTKTEFFGKGFNIKREVVFGNSRFDLFFTDAKRKIFIEVKGVTLESNGIALFPDAPTERGIKHINELIKATKEGYEAYIFFVIQMDEIELFKPNVKTHPEFASALKKAVESGVGILAYNCYIDRESIEIKRKVSVVL